MSIEFEMEEDGQIRVRVDTEGQRAMSEAMDPVDLIRQVMDEAELDIEDLEGQLSQDPDAVEEPTEPVDPETEEPTEPTEGFPSDSEAEEIETPEDPERGLDEDPDDDGDPTGGDMTDDITEPVEEEQEPSKIDESAPSE